MRDLIVVFYDYKVGGEKEVKRIDTICDKIYYFFNLEDGEKKEILQHITICSKCRKIYDQLILLKDNFDGNHINEGLLDRYITFTNFPGEKDSNSEELLDFEFRLIENHINKCSVCKAKLVEKQAVYVEMNKFWENANLPDFILNPTNMGNKQEKNVLKKLISQIKSFKVPGIPGFRQLALSAIIIISIFIVFPFFNLEEPTLQQLAQIEEIYIPYFVRSSTNGFQAGIEFFNQKNYTGAILKFQEYLNHSSDLDNKNYAHYLLGLSYVLKASSRENNENTGNNSLLLVQGVENLKAALTDTGNNLLNENIFWYLGKAYLMSNDIITAKYNFEKVKALNGSKKAASIEVLDRLQTIQN